MTAVPNELIASASFTYLYYDVYEDSKLHVQIVEGIKKTYELSTI